MTRIGLSVPLGFTLTLKAYKDLMSFTGADIEIKEYLDSVDHALDHIHHFNESSAELRRIVESKDMPQKIGEAILSHYEQSHGKGDS